MNSDKNVVNFSGFLNQLIAADYVKGAALDITKFVIEQGSEKLNPKQKRDFQLQVIIPHVHQRCEMCRRRIPWSEMFQAIGKGFCPACASQIKKRKKP